ncbi:hypothetical protein EJ04DRAFT_565812 [Polyplosphaeria fusca]|uniref:Uncharacterized protein n=1 Tax=Polyplosphaeria fusca TaxID=682080 RepID=A0A9P4QUA4_9PLEO|nr:hypothetical protein EJ04DRAFT_565812 [Polyplosphaeria fusca]
MTSEFNGAVDGHIVIPGPHCGPGGTMHFNFGSTFAHDQRPKHEPFSTVPFRKDPDFVDRPDISDWIDQKCKAPASRAALVGLGGVGWVNSCHCYDISKT